MHPFPLSLQLCYPYANDSKLLLYLKKSYVPVFLIELSVFKLWVLVHQQSMTNIGQCIYFHTITCHYCCCWGIAYMYITFAVCLNLLVEWLRLILFYYRLWSKSNGHRTCSCFKSCLKICRKEYWRHGYCWGIEIKCCFTTYPRIIQLQFTMCTLWYQHCDLHVHGCGNILVI